MRAGAVRTGAFSPWGRCGNGVLGRDVFDVHPSAPRATPRTVLYLQDARAPGSTRSVCNFYMSPRGKQSSSRPLGPFRSAPATRRRHGRRAGSLADGPAGAAPPTPSRIRMPVVRGAATLTRGANHLTTAALAAIACAAVAKVDVVALEAAPVAIDALLRAPIDATTWHTARRALTSSGIVGRFAAWRRVATTPRTVAAAAATATLSTAAATELARICTAVRPRRRWRRRRRNTRTLEVS